MSLSKFFVLCVLHQKPMHGYEVVQAVERTTRGCCSPTEGTVYPRLKEFEAGGYLKAHADIVQGRERKIYTLTRKGREAFQTAMRGSKPPTVSWPARRQRPRSRAHEER
jgi:PadR family transcriptional regulator, regulatory protein PadR